MHDSIFLNSFDGLEKALLEANSTWLDQANQIVESGDYDIDFVNNSNGMNYLHQV